MSKKTNCVNCNKKINTKKDDHATGESLGEVWCLACTYQDAYEVTQERLDLVELAEAKARIELEEVDGYYSALLKKRVLQVEALQAENKQLRTGIVELCEYIGYQPHSDLAENVVDILYNILNDETKVGETNAI